MKTFKLEAFVTISLYTEVEAETLEEAIEIAEERDLMTIVDNGHDDETIAWMADELDGTVKNITHENS